MSAEKKKLRLLLCADDPDANLSYGILSKMLIDKWYKYYDIHYLSLQYGMGSPINREGKYIKYPAHNQGERNPTYLTALFPEVQPDIFWTNFDVQHYENVMKFVPPGATWIGWIPWDNHDLDQIPRARAVLSKVDTRIAISKFGYDFLNNNGVRIDDYIYNIVDTDVYKPVEYDDEKNLEIKRKIGYNPAFKYLLFVGRPNWRKRLMHVLSILKELVDRGNKNIRLILHTNFDDPARTFNIRELINALDLGDYIINSGFHWDIGIDKEDLRALYAISDLYIAPHGGEGFGMPIGEAMACGTPFVASDICTTKEFCGNNFERGLPAPVAYPLDATGNILKDIGVARPYPIVSKFAEIIESIIYDANKLKRMGENGAKWVQENCSPQVIADKWMKVFDSYDINYARVVDYK